ncbi:MAG: hypothetical protein K8R41_09795 [Bacteroidales bacterium]|nr:hypothetical protein [Bacteroidales bacterium]
MKSVKCLQIIFLLVFSSSLFAQLPNFSDPFFDLKEHVLTPNQVKEHHVKSCLVKLDGDYFFKLYYDGNGRVIKKSDEKTFYIYNGNDKILVGHIFDSASYIGVYNVGYNTINDLDRIEYQHQSDGETEEISTQLNYENGKLASIQQNGNSSSLFGSSFNDTISFKYAQDATISEVSYHNVSSYKYTDMSGNSMGTNYTTVYVYSGNKLITVNYAESTDKYIYDSKGRLIRIDKLKTDSETKTECTYEYNDRGLVSKKVGNLLYEYEYEYINPTKVSVEYSGNSEQIAMFNFSQSYGYEQHKLVNGKTEIILYPPVKDFYIIKTDSMQVAVILSPGKDVSISFSRISLDYAEGDKDNAIFKEIELAKAKATEQSQNQKQYYSYMGSAIVEMVKKHPEFIGFLIYTELWDIKNNKELFFEYSERMQKLYPLSFKVNEVYFSLKQEQK